MFEGLLRKTRHLFWICCGLGIAEHTLLSQIGGVEAEQRLTKSLVLKKHPQPKRRRVQREKAAGKAQRHGEARGSKMQASMLAGRLAHLSASVSWGVWLGAAKMEPRARYGASGPASVGTDVVRGDEIELSELIGVSSERFGTRSKPGDRLLFESVRKCAAPENGLIQGALPNTMEDPGYVFAKAK